MKITIPIVLLSAGYLFVLSGMMGIRAGSWTFHDDSFFDTDLAGYEKALAEPGKVRPSPLHILIPFVWRPMGLGLAAIYRAAGAGDGSGILGARTLVASFAALGIGAFWVLGSTLGVRAAPRIALTAVALFATSNVVCSVPESYGISLAMLLISAGVIWSGMEPHRKAAWLAILAILCGGATITNVVYPGLALVYLFLKSPESGGLRPSWLSASRLRVLTIFVVVSALVMGGAFFAALPTIGKKFPKLKEHLLLWLHFRIFRDPSRTIHDWGASLVYPITGPYPSIRPGLISFGTHLTLTWTWFHVVATVAWSALLASGLVMGVRDRATRSFTLGLVGWVAFNFAIHSVWGGFDNFLYSPHWSWALLVIALLAARGPRPWPVVAACVAIVPAQIMTLRWISLAIQGY